MTNWESVDVPAGSYIGWGTEPGQTVIGKVLTFNMTGGTDFSGAPCPELQLELIEPAYSMNKDGQRFDYDAGQLVNINAGGANLKRGVTAAQPSPGDLIKIALEKLEPLSGGRSVKVFAIYIARGAGKSTAAPAAAPPPQPQAAAATPAAAAAQDLATPPKDVDPAFWATLGEAQKRAYYDAVGAH